MTVPLIVLAVFVVARRLPEPAVLRSAQDARALARTGRRDRRAPRHQRPRREVDAWRSSPWPAPSSASPSPTRSTSVTGRPRWPTRSSGPSSPTPGTTTRRSPVHGRPRPQGVRRHRLVRQERDRRGGQRRRLTSCEAAGREIRTTQTGFVRSYALGAGPRAPSSSPGSCSRRRCGDERPGCLARTSRRRHGSPAFPHPHAPSVAHPGRSARSSPRSCHAAGPRSPSRSRCCSPSLTGALTIGILALFETGVAGFQLVDTRQLGVGPGDLLDPRRRRHLAVAGRADRASCSRSRCSARRRTATPRRSTRGSWCSRPAASAASWRSTCSCSSSSSRSSSCRCTSSSAAGATSERRYAAMKFFLFTMFGSAFMLVGTVALAYLHAKGGPGHLRPPRHRQQPGRPVGEHRRAGCSCRSPSRSP